VVLLTTYPDRSPLQWAFYKNRLEISRLLIAHGANGDHVSTLGWDPVLYLIEGNLLYRHISGHDVEDFLRLLDNDRMALDLHITNANNENALQIAARYHDGSVIDRLFNLGASMKVYGQSAWRYPANPINRAIAYGNFSAFQALVQYYPDLNESDDRGLTMLSLAARFGFDDITECLLRLGAEEVLPGYDLDGDGGSVEKYDWDCKPWTSDTYEQYLAILERLNRVSICNATDDGVEREIFWNANEEPVFL
jgi:ankyrin repeat protein